MQTNLIQTNLIAIKNTISDFEKKYHRPPNSVSLLAATKGQSIEKINSAIAAGQHIFGENYLQEALPKISFFQNENLEWHFIGPIQSNKTRKIAEHFSWVQSIDTFKIAERLNAQRPPQLPKLNICIEVNINNELTKSGIQPSAVASLLKECSRLTNLKLRGLMAIPAASYDFATQRLAFKEMKKIFDDCQKQGFELDVLSMGMSDDLEAAIAEGSTMVRIGTKIFGKRR